MIKKVLWSIYNLVPFKKNIFQILKPLGLSERITQHLVFDGVIKLKLNEGKSILMQNRRYPLEQIFFWKGINGWEQYSNMLWQALAKRSDVILDIGANTGVYTLLAKAANPEVKVYSFEPVRNTFKILQENIALNNCSNVTLINDAISDKEGEAEFYDMKDSILYEASLEKAHVDALKHDRSRFTSYKVKIVPLTKVIEEHKIEKIDLLKVDVETHEPPVIAGMGEYLQKYQPILLIEILNEDVAKRLTPYFNSDDYVFYDIDEKSGYRKVSSLEPSSTFNFIICPKHKENILDEAMAEVKATL